MEKVKVSKDVFVSMKKLQFDYKGEEIFDHLIHLTEKYISGNGWKSIRYKALNNLNLKEFMACLHYGYELEETKEEKLTRYYYNRGNARSVFNTSEEIIYKKGIIDCYEILEGKKFDLK